MIYIIMYLLGILMANLLVCWFGIISIGWLMFPAGAIMIGLTFSFRDMVQKKYGKWKCWIWMLFATLITFIFNQQIAIASVTAFLLSEGVDWLIYTITKGSFIKRLILSNIVGVPIDSIIFVGLMFGLNTQVIVGQSIIKILSSFLVIPFLKKRLYETYKGQK